MAVVDVTSIEVLTERSDRDVLSAARQFLAGYKQATAQVYALGIDQWIVFCDHNGLHPFDARRAHFDLWRRHLEQLGKAPATISNRLGGVSMWYRWMAEEEILVRNPAAHVRRPKVDSESSTVGLERTEISRLFITAANARPSEYALVALLFLNGLRVSEALGINIEQLGVQRGHRTAAIVGKGDKAATIPLPPPVCRAVDLAIGDRTSGPLILDTLGRRMTPGSARWVLDKLGRRAGLGHIHPHQGRHCFVTQALDAGVALRDVQNSARHADPRTTSRYDRARTNLDRHASYIVSSFLATG